MRAGRVWFRRRAGSAPGCLVGRSAQGWSAGRGGGPRRDRRVRRLGELHRLGKRLGSVRDHDRSGRKRCRMHEYTKRASVLGLSIRVVVIGPEEDSEQEPQNESRFCPRGGPAAPAHETQDRANHLVTLLATHSRPELRAATDAASGIGFRTAERTDAAAMVRGLAHVHLQRIRNRGGAVPSGSCFPETFRKEC